MPPTVSDAAHAFKAAFTAAAELVLRPLEDPDHELKVCFGHPGKNQPDDIVATTRVVTTQSVATMSTNRSREQDLTLTVVVSVFRGGGEDQEEIASARAHELLTALEEYVRVTDTTLGGVVRWCFCTSTTEDGVTDPQILTKGRLIEITAEFQAPVRITS